jgi:hypothetical protein
VMMGSAVKGISRSRRWESNLLSCVDHRHGAHSTYLAQ